MTSLSPGGRLRAAQSDLEVTQPAQRQLQPAQSDLEAGQPAHRRQFLFLVRHAESRWNQAQRDRNIINMFRECDHGITLEGRKQAERLRQSIDNATLGDDPWSFKFGSPCVIFISPFTRALQTAVIALNGIIASGRTDLAVIRNLREKKNFGGQDSVGIAIGPAIKDRLLQEFEHLYSVNEDLVEIGPRVHGWPRIRRSLSTQVRLEIRRAFFEFARQLSFDTREVQECWWNRIVETDSDFVQRLKMFMEQIRLCGKERIIIVGHSHFFRRLFCLAPCRQTQKCELAERLKKVLIPNCGVIGLEIHWVNTDQYIIEEVVPLFGTVVKDAPVRNRTRDLKLCISKLRKLWGGIASCRQCRRCCRHRKATNSRDLEM